jgi:putative transcriptional regulator
MTQKDWDSIANEPEAAQDDPFAPNETHNDESEQMEVKQEAAPSATVELEEKLTKSQKEAADHYDRALRAASELENVRKRAEKDVANAHKRGVEKILNELMPMNTVTGQFLISMPAVKDDMFERAVVYVCQHDDRGALGFIINKPIIDVYFDDVFTQLEIPTTDTAASNLVLLDGGPVQQERGFVIHPESNEWHSTFKPNPGISVTTSVDILEAIACGEGPEKLLVALGYAGWDAGQLEDEIKSNLWLTTDMNSDVLFNIPFAKRWQRAANVFGVDINTMVQEAGHA